MLRQSRGFVGTAFFVFKGSAYGEGRCPYRRQILSSRERRENAKKNGVLMVHGHFSQAINEAIGQKGYRRADTY
jgi:hypothetical protein